MDKGDEEMGGWYHFVSLVNGVFNTPAVQPAVCIENKKELSKGRYGKTRLSDICR